MSKIINVLGNYQFYSQIDTIEKISGGNINITYKITLADGTKYILQKINTSVFKNPILLMDNITKVTKKFSEQKNLLKMLDKMQVLNIKFTREGKSYTVYNDEYYRIYDFVCNSVTYSNTSDLTIIENAGRAFGFFAKSMNTGDKVSLVDVIENFHNTSYILNKLVESYQKATISYKNKAKQVYEYIMEKQNTVNKIYRETLCFRNRIVHNDAKCNNVAFCPKDKSVRCVLDLDTVMNGSFMADFGDGARSISCSTEEDEKNLSFVKFNMSKFKAYTKGYVREILSIATPEEIETLKYGPLIITIELAARFLTDYLDGNIYFKTDYLEHNLDRAKCQAKLALDIEEKQTYIQKVIENARKS